MNSDSPNDQAVNKAYKLRIYPSKAQEQILLQTIGACRFIHNYYLTLQVNAYLQTGKNIPYVDLSRDLVKLRNGNEYPWLKETRFVPLQQALRILDASYGRYFKKQAGFPKFKSKKSERQSFRKPEGWRLNGKKLEIQKNMVVKCRGRLPPMSAQVKSLTVSVTQTGKWFASITTVEVTIPDSNLVGSIGIDMGLTDLAITSEGNKYPNLRSHEVRLKHLKRLGQSLARKRNGSKRREKAKLAIARLHEKIANQRMNHLHQVSSAITSKNHALIAVEDLSVINMVKNRRLSRSISDASWSELVRQVEYKQKWRGGKLVKIDRFFPSTKTCSNCQFMNQNVQLSVRQWKCPGCGTDHDRDVNAAKNIIKQAEAQLVAESTEGSRKARVTGSLKRGYAYV